MQHISKLEKFEIRAVIKYLCMKGMPPKEIHEAFMKNLGRESPSYSTVKKWTTKFKMGRESVKADGQSGPPKMPPLMKTSRSCTPWFCVIGGWTYEA